MFRVDAAAGDCYRNTDLGERRRNGAAGADGRPGGNGRDDGNRDDGRAGAAAVLRSERESDGEQLVLRMSLEVDELDGVGRGGWLSGCGRDERAGWSWAEMGGDAEWDHVAAIH
jgi:hypothetical protein